MELDQLHVIAVRVEQRRNDSSPRFPALAPDERNPLRFDSRLLHRNVVHYQVDEVSLRLDGPAARKKTLTHKQFGLLTNLKKAAAAEKPLGQWNRYEINVKGDTVTLVINGRQVNRATGCDVVAGHICLTAEGNEIQFRNVKLVPLDK